MPSPCADKLHVEPVSPRLWQKRSGEDLMHKANPWQPQVGASDNEEVAREKLMAQAICDGAVAVRDAMTLEYAQLRSV